MLSFFSSDDSQSLKSELLKNSFNESKVQKIVDAGADISDRDVNGRTMLFELAKKKRIESIKFLVKNGININQEDNYGKTVLSEAVHRDDGVMIRFLLDMGADVNYINSSGRTIMQDVALEGNHRIFRILLSHNPDLNIKDRYGKTVLFDAVEGGNIDIIKDVLNNTDDSNIVDNDGQSALFYAVLMENPEIAKFLVSYGLDINLNDKRRQNVLFNSVIMGSDHLDLIEMFIKKGVKLNQKDKDDKTILDEILKILNIVSDPYVSAEGKYKLAKSERNYLKLTTILMEHGLAIDRTDKNGRSVLFREVARKNYETIDFLLASGADINAYDNAGKTVLFDAILEGLGNITMIDYLIKKGADIDQRDLNERTVIDDLVEIILIQQNGKKPSNRRFLDIDKDEDYMGLLKRILAHKPRINDPKKNGQTVIYDAINHNNLELIKTLLNNGADANITDIEGNTPLSILIDEGVKIKRPRDRELFIERLVFLLKFRVDVNAVDNEGKTIFHKAVLADDLEVVEKLLTKRADLDIQDRQGRTALHHTQWKGNYKIARLLIAAGADMNKPDYAGFTVLNYAAILGHANLVMVLISSGVLMYNKNKKSKAVIKFFQEREENLNKLIKGNITDSKMKNSIKQVIDNLRSEIHEYD